MAVITRDVMQFERERGGAPRRHGQNGAGAQAESFELSGNSRLESVLGWHRSGEHDSPPAGLTRSQILGLQRTSGNAAVAELLVQRQGADAGVALAGGVATVAAPPDAGTAAADAGTAAATCPLKDFSGSNFVGSTARIDSQFEASLNSVNAAAVANDVQVYVTSSFRTSTTVPGAIVTPAS